MNKILKISIAIFALAAGVYLFPIAVQAQQCSSEEIYCANYQACIAPIVNPECAAQNRSDDLCGVCGGCVSGYQDCSGTCVQQAPQNTTPNCTAYSWCTGNCATCASGYTLTSGVCEANPVYVQLQSSSPGALESGHINITGDARAGGDVYLANGKAIRVDGSSSTNFYIGNWATGGNGVLVGIYGRFWVNGNTWIDGDLYNAGNAIVRGNVALGGYNPDSTITLTTPSLYAGKAQIGIGSSDPGANGLSVSGNITSGGKIQGDFVGAAGTPCAENGILKKVSGNWQCSSVGGATGNETDPFFTVWENAPVLASLSMTGELLLAGYTTDTLPASGAGDGSLIYDSTAKTLRFWSEGTWKSVMADGAGPASPWSVSDGNIYNNNTGNVGIGVLAPAERLEVTAGNDTTPARVRITETDSGQNPELQLKYDISAGGHWAMYIDKLDGDKLKFWQGSPVLEINGDGNIVAEGSIRAKGCFGPVFAQTSANTWTGNVDGYNGANAKCPAGTHVCTTGEMLNSINCGANLSTMSGNGAWVSIGIASLPTPSNDCNGWASYDPGWQGVHYVSSANGGNFYARACSEVLPFACCR